MKTIIHIQKKYVRNVVEYHNTLTCGHVKITNEKYNLYDKVRCYDCHNY